MTGRTNTYLCKMTPGFLLFCLPILFTYIASISSLELYDDFSSEENEGRAATPAPILRPYLSNLKLKMNRFDDRLDQFLINADEGRNEPVFVKTAEEVLKEKLMGLLTQSMQELDRKIKKVNKLHAEDSEKTAGVSEVVDYVNRSHGDLVAEYKNIEKRQRSVHPVDILIAYNKVRKGNVVAASLLHMVSGNQLVDQKIRQPPWKNKISWAYYDEYLG